jgi:hypothetical protein
MWRLRGGVRQAPTGGRATDALARGEQQSLETGLARLLPSVVVVAGMSRLPGAVGGRVGLFSLRRRSNSAAEGR